MHIHCFGLFYFCLTFSHIPIYLFTLRWEILVHETSYPFHFLLKYLYVENISYSSYSQKPICFIRDRHRVTAIAYSLCTGGLN